MSKSLSQNVSSGAKSCPAFFQHVGFPSQRIASIITIPRERLSAFDLSLWLTDWHLKVASFGVSRLSLYLSKQLNSSQATSPVFLYPCVLVPRRISCVLGWVTSWMLVANEVAVHKAVINSIHLLTKQFKGKSEKKNFRFIVHLLCKKIHCQLGRTPSSVTASTVLL